MVVSRRDRRAGRYVPCAALWIVCRVSKNNKAGQGVNGSIRRVERNAKGKLIRTARFQSGMTDSDAFFGRREELDGGES